MIYKEKNLKDDEFIHARLSITLLQILLKKKLVNFILNHKIIII